MHYHPHGLAATTEAAFCYRNKVIQQPEAASNLRLQSSHLKYRLKSRLPVCSRKYQIELFTLEEAFSDSLVKRLQVKKIYRKIKIHQKNVKNFVKNFVKNIRQKYSSKKFINSAKLNPSKKIRQKNIQNNGKHTASLKMFEERQ